MTLHDEIAEDREYRQLVERVAELEAELADALAGEDNYAEKMDEYAARVAELEGLLRRLSEWDQLHVGKHSDGAFWLSEIRAALSPPKDKRCSRCGGGTDVRACTEGERCPVLHPPKDKP